MKRPHPVGSLDRATRYKVWKEQHVPLIYDWVSSRSFVWPHAAVQWGAASKDDPSRRDRSLNANNYTSRALFLAERTGLSNRDPNTLLHFDVRVPQPLTLKPADIAKPWQDEAVVTERVDQMSTRDFWLRKRIVHPGEVNRIRLAGPNLVVTHTDNPHLFVWDFDRQPDRKSKDMTASTPTCTLVGHEGNADYAIDVARSKPGFEDTWIISGGSDCAVLMWRLSDYQKDGQLVSPFVRMRGSRGKTTTAGHAGTVEDVSFNGSDRNLVVSVGRDSAMLIWDVRTPDRAVSFVRNAHQGDINCCDFGGVREHCIATGGSDSVVRIWDRRFLKNAQNEQKPLRTLQGHTNEITNLMWNRHVTDVFASGGEDGQVLVWNVGEPDRRPPQESNIYPTSPELIFRHVGHGIVESKVVDLDWLPSETDPWCLSTLSEPVGEGGSILQIWRVSDLIYRSKEEVAADLRQFARSKVQC